MIAYQTSLMSEFLRISVAEPWYILSLPLFAKEILRSNIPKDITMEALLI